jgi:recombinational DNA repair protein RecR
VNPNFSQGSVPGSPQKPIEVDGDIKVDVQFQNLPTNLTSEQMAEVIKAFNMAINEQSFKNYIINLNRRENSFGPNQMATFQ